jgi:hypothetical protein
VQSSAAVLRVQAAFEHFAGRSELARIGQDVLFLWHNRAAGRFATANGTPFAHFRQNFVPNVGNFTARRLFIELKLVPERISFGTCL